MGCRQVAAHHVQDDPSVLQLARHSSSSSPLSVCTQVGLPCRTEHKERSQPIAVRPIVLPVRPKPWPLKTLPNSDFHTALYFCGCCTGATQRVLPVVSVQLAWLFQAMHMCNSRILLIVLRKYNGPKCLIALLLRQLTVLVQTYSNCAYIIDRFLSYLLIYVAGDLLQDVTSHK